MTFTTPSFFADKMGVLVPVNNLSSGGEHQPPKNGSTGPALNAGITCRGKPSLTHFNGSDYSPEHDDARLTGQLLRVKQCMADGAWRTLAEIEAVTGDPQASISAQLRHCKKARFGSHTLNKRPRGDRSHGLWEYQLT